jgi:hypothetical protein
MFETLDIVNHEVNSSLKPGSELTSGPSGMWRRSLWDSWGIAASPACSRWEDSSRTASCRTEQPTTEELGRGILGIIEQRQHLLPDMPRG